jgi:hypothetical protein
MSFTQGLHYLAIGNCLGAVFGWVAINIDATSDTFVSFDSIGIVLAITHSINFALDDLHIIMLVVVAGTASFVLAFPNTGVLVRVGVEHGQTAALDTFKGPVHVSYPTL